MWGREIKLLLSEGPKGFRFLTLWARPRLGVGERKNVYFFDLGLASFSYGKECWCFFEPFPLARFFCMHGRCLCSDL